jgi:hypothetical protein
MKFGNEFVPFEVRINVGLLTYKIGKKTWRTYKLVGATLAPLNMVSYGNRSSKGTQLWCRTFFCKTTWRLH